MMKYLFVFVVGSALVFGSGCQTTQSGSAAESGTAGGAFLGAGLGAILGNNINGLSSAEGAIAGALVGGLLGHTTGKQQDQLDAQEKKIAQMNRERSQTVVHVKNSNGSQTPVVLIMVGADQWRGPKGEIYTGLPTEEQLRAVYGMSVAAQTKDVVVQQGPDQPVARVAQPSVVGMNRVVVHISNSNGSLTPVVLMKSGVNQWRGPRGEIYNGLPTEQQLALVYGL
jgi:hypothetical protein